LSARYTTIEFQTNIQSTLLSFYNFFSFYAKILFVPHSLKHLWFKHLTNFFPFYAGYIPPSTLASDFKQIFNSPLGSDVTLTVEGHTGPSIFAHRVILAWRSDTFKVCQCFLYLKAAYLHHYEPFVSAL
jgi:hypothetical protein